MIPRITKKVRFLLLLLVLASLAIGAYQIWSYKDYTDLNELTIGNQFSKTKVLFAYRNNPATIWDKYNKLYKIYGNLPDSVQIANETRIVKFTKPAILKSDADSIDVGQTEVKYKGYMGISTEARRFFVDEQGEISEIDLVTPRFTPDF